MSDRSEQPYLLISPAADAESTWPAVPIAASPLCLGRPEPDAIGPGFIDLRLESVSRRHARIWREGDGYTLENWEGRYGIGLFERELRPGDRHELRHGYVFRVPALADHARVMFVAGSRETHLWPLYLEPALRRVYVFGSQVDLPPQAFALLRHLYERRGAICPYHEIIDSLWPGLRAKGVVEKGRNLDVLLANLRRALSEASGGFTFMQTVRGEGIRLVV